MADTVSLSSTTQRDLILAFQTALQDFDGIKVNTLIQQGLDVRHLCTDAPKYYTALHELVINFTSHPLLNRPGKLLAKFTDVLTVLLENGVKVNDRDRRYQNQTALHLAAGVPGQQDTIAALIRVGARAGDPDSGQQTALHKAAISGSVENVVVLIDNGADPNVLDNFGHSPLHMAVKRKEASYLIIIIIVIIIIVVIVIVIVIIVIIIIAIVIIIIIIIVIIIVLLLLSLPLLLYAGCPSRDLQLQVGFIIFNIIVITIFVIVIIGCRLKLLRLELVALVPRSIIVIIIIFIFMRLIVIFPRKFFIPQVFVLSRWCVCNSYPSSMSIKGLNE